MVEIGPGTGALTEELVLRYPDLTAIEIDERAVQLLRHTLPGLDVRHRDVLEVDWTVMAEERGGPLHVIGNLPYNITSPILFGLLDAREYLREAVLMMQLEVAQRIVAVPRTKAYGILSVLVQLQAQPELAFQVSRHVFYPKPDVTSAVLRLTFDAPTDSDALGVDVEFLREVVRSAFGQRRKTLRNSLSRWTRAQGITLPNDWDGARAEELTPADFLTLAKYLAERAT